MKPIALLLLLSCGALHAQENDLKAWTDIYIAGLAPSRHFRGNVLVIKDGKALVNKSYGLADESWNIPNGEDARFEIASLTKQFTAVAILQLQEAGKLSVQDPISKFYPQAPETWHAITIEKLLTHTSGLPNNKLEDFNKGIAVPYTPEELIATFRNRPLVAVPGTKWAYTNTEYYLLAHVIEKVSGQAYGTYLSDHIFKPLAMTHSEFSPTRVVIPQMTEGYTRENGSLRHRDYF